MEKKHKFIINWRDSVKTTPPVDNDDWERILNITLERIEAATSAGFAVKDVIFQFDDTEEGEIITYANKYSEPV